MSQRQIFARTFRATSLIILLSLSSFVIATPALAGPPVIHTVTFSENDSPSDTVDTFQLGTSTATLTPFSSLSPSFSNPGYVFTGWNTSANGTGTSYGDGATYSFSSDLDLYAQWSIVLTHTVTFSENDSPSDTVDTFQLGTSTATLTPFSSLSPSFSNPGYVFTGWNTSANGTGTSYGDGATYSFSSDLHLFAQWDAVTQTQPSRSESRSTPTEAMDRLRI